MTTQVKQTEVNEVIENLKNGVRYGNEASGISFSYGKTMMRLDNKGIKFYSTIEEMARAIVRFTKRGY